MSAEHPGNVNVLDWPAIDSANQCGLADYFDFGNLELVRYGEASRVALVVTKETDGVGLSAPVVITATDLYPGDVGLLVGFSNTDSGGAAIVPSYRMRWVFNWLPKDWEQARIRYFEYTKEGTADLTVVGALDVSYFRPPGSTTLGRGVIEGDAKTWPRVPGLSEGSCPYPPAIPGKACYRYLHFLRFPVGLATPDETNPPAAFFDAFNPVEARNSKSPKRTFPMPLPEYAGYLYPHFTAPSPVTGHRTRYRLEQNGIY